MDLNWGLEFWKKKFRWLRAENYARKYVKRKEWAGWGFY